MPDVRDVFDPDRAYQEFMDAGRDFADKNAAASLLEETRQVLKARLQLQSVAKTEAAKEAEARGSLEYEEHVRAMVEARHQADLAKVRWIAVQELAQMRRTEESSRRAEMQLSRVGAFS